MNSKNIKKRNYYLFFLISFSKYTLASKMKVIIYTETTELYAFVLPIRETHTSK